MKTITERLNMSYTDRKGSGDSWEINIINSINSYETLCLICADLDINNVDDNDFYSASIHLENFINANKDNKPIFIWFD